VRFLLHSIYFFIYCVFNCKCDTTTKFSKPNDKYNFRSLFLIRSLATNFILWELFLVHSSLFSPFLLIYVMILLLFLYLLMFILTHLYIPHLIVLCLFPSNRIYISFDKFDAECLLLFRTKI
jgi:hypothetical protein